jgi:hypothetical protein
MKKQELADLIDECCDDIFERREPVTNVKARLYYTLKEHLKIKTMTLTINYREVELEIEGVYTEGEKQTYDYIGSSDTFQIETVYVGGVNIYNMLEGVQEDTLEEICIAKITKHN